MVTKTLEKVLSITFLLIVDNKFLSIGTSSVCPCTVPACEHIGIPSCVCHLVPSPLFSPPPLLPPFVSYLQSYNETYLTVRSPWCENLINLVIDPGEDRITAIVVHTHPTLVHIFLHMSTETVSPEDNFKLFVQNPQRNNLYVIQKRVTKRDN
jgi:hypothetical protein